MTQTFGNIFYIISITMRFWIMILNYDFDITRLKVNFCPRSLANTFLCEHHQILNNFYKYVDLSNHSDLSNLNHPISLLPQKIKSFLTKTKNILQLFFIKGKINRANWKNLYAAIFRIFHTSTRNLRFKFWQDLIFLKNFDKSSAPTTMHF